MLGESRLNVYVLDAEISPRLRERIQAQVQTAMRSLPVWMFGLLTARMNELGVSVLTLIVDPVASAKAARPLSLGDIEGRPAALLRPRVSANKVEWGQDTRYLVAKAVGYLTAPPPDESFWARWAGAVESDGLREIAAQSSAAWQDETDLGLFVEMFAAYALRDGDDRWGQLPAVHGVLQEWRGGVA